MASTSTGSFFSRSWHGWRRSDGAGRPYARSGTCGEERAFWWLTGGWSKLGQLLDRDPRVALVVDTCDVDRGEVLQVTARGTAKVYPFDADRARRWGSGYLGPEERHWRRFQDGVFDDPTTRFVVLEPTVLRARDLSY